MRNIINKIYNLLNKLNIILTNLTIKNIYINIASHWNYIIINNFINPIFCIKNINPYKQVNYLHY
jgi:hypothetical protein